MNQGDVANAFEDIRTQFTNFITNYPWIIVVVVSIILIAIFINRLTPVLRVQNAVSKIQGYLNTGNLKTDIYPLSYWIKNFKKGENPFGNYVDNSNMVLVPQSGKKFTDYHIMSSAKSYLVKNRHYDFCSLRVLQSLLLYGVKFVELDIFNAGFGENNSYPVVTNGKDHGEWKTCINKLAFEDCCNTILKYGIQYWQQNWTNADPIFLYLNCHSLRTDTINNMSETIYRVFTDTYLLPINYGHGGKNTTIIDKNPEKFYNRIIIISNITDKKSLKFDEKINIYTDSPAFKTFAFQNDSIDDGNLKTNNEKQMCMVYDNSPGNELVNYNPIIPWIKGVQFVAMHFQNNDSNLKQYLKMFSFQYPDSEKDPKKKKKSFIVNTAYRLKKIEKKD